MSLGGGALHCDTPRRNTRPAHSLYPPSSHSRHTNPAIAATSRDPADVVVTLNADFCIDFDSALLDLASNDANVAYYVKCDSEPSLINPMQTALTLLDSALELATVARSELVNQVDSTVCTVNGLTETKCQTWQVFTAPNNVRVQHNHDSKPGLLVGWLVGFIRLDP